VNGSTNSSLNPRMRSSEPQFALPRYSLVGWN
jgi:hypothetical protein